MPQLGTMETLGCHSLRSTLTLLIALLTLLFACTGCKAFFGASSRETPTPAVPCLNPPKNAILFIGDGMGHAQVDAGSLYVYGRRGALSFQQFPHSAQMSVRAANAPVTDSGASATAMATGRKVNLRVISMAIPGDGKPLTTILELYQSRGRSAGLVSTAYLTHATPAAFAAHRPSRYEYAGIAADYFERSRPNVLLGGAQYLAPEQARAAGYTVVETAEALDVIDLQTIDYLSGQFGEDHLPYSTTDTPYPSLPTMTAAALALVGDDPDGFFLLVEGARIDHAGHANEIGLLVEEVTEFAEAASVAREWAEGREGTLILVTADHETGGLEILAPMGKGLAPEVRWASDEHTAGPVPIYGWGVNAEHVRGEIDNTDVFRLLGGCALSTAMELRPAQ